MRFRSQHLTEKLKQELPGILAWCIEGFWEWQAHGLGECPEVTEAVTEYRSSMDTLGGFLEEHCVVGDDKRVKASELYACYKAWCQEVGEHTRSKQVFGRLLTERGFSRVRGTGNTHYRDGLELKGDRSDL